MVAVMVPTPRGQWEGSISWYLQLIEPHQAHRECCMNELVTYKQGPLYDKEVSVHNFTVSCWPCPAPPTSAPHGGQEFAAQTHVSKQESKGRHLGGRALELS